MRLSRRRAAGRTLALSSILALPTAARAADAFATWIGPSGGSWWNALNWSGGVVPYTWDSLAYHVRLDGASGDSVAVLDQEARVTSLQIDSGDRLNLAAALHMRGDSLQNSGTIEVTAKGSGVYGSGIVYWNDLNLSGGGTLRGSIGPYNYSPGLNVTNDNTIFGGIFVTGNLHNTG